MNGIKSFCVARAASIGTVLVLSGPSSSLAQQVIRTYSSGQPNDDFGDALDVVGDLDADGVTDVIVGAETGGGFFNPQAGMVYVFSGDDPFNLLYSFTGPQSQYRLGYDVAGLGDLDGDGVSDFGATALYVSSNNWIWSGQDGHILAQIPGGGYAIVPLGDTNGDGVNDVAIGKNQVVEIWGGGSLGLLQTVLPPNGIVSYFGFAIANIGDVNGDFVADFVVGAPSDPGTCIKGFAACFSGANGKDLWETWGNVPGDQFGASVSSAGDMNGDGVGDVVIGAWQSTTAPSYPCTGAGRVDVVDGKTGIQLTALYPASTFGNFGFLVAAGLDLNGNGVNDILVHELQSFGNAGVLPLDGFSYSPIYSITNPYPPLNAFGYGLKATGDVNGDEFPDFLVGTPPPSYLPGAVGAVDLFSGAPIGVSVFGNGCSASSGIAPRIAATGVPTIGSTFSINLSKATPAVQALFFFGISNTTWSGIPLPLSLAIVGMPNCSLNVSGEIIVPLLTIGGGQGGGISSVTFVIPSNPFLIGVSVFAQWFVMNTAGSGTLGAMTKGLKVTFQ